MTEQIGLWRATYTPGDWIVLGGPTSLVILQPAPAHMSALVERLWEVVLHAHSMDDLVAELAQHNVSRMPDFAAFFWHGGRMRTLLRGRPRITDADSGEVIAEGADVLTWTEVGLGDVRRIHVRLDAEDDVPGSSLRLPLVVGAVSAGSVELDASPSALVHSPQASPGSPSADAVPLPLPGQAPVAEIESARSAVVDAEVVESHIGGSEAAEQVPGEPDRSSARPAHETAPTAEPPADDFDPFGQGDVFQLFGEAEQRPDQESHAFQPPAAAVPEEPPAPVDPHNPFVVPAVRDTEDEVATDLLPQAGPGPADSAYTHGPQPGAAPESRSPFGGGGDFPTVAEQAAPGREGPEQEASGEGMVLGVTCALNHPNPPEAQRCRRCGGPLQGQPRLMPQPVMAVLRPSDGLPVDVDRSVLIGRSPQASKLPADERPRLMTVVSPSTDISRTHLQVSPAGWEVVATDLNSTNGTLLIRPGQPEPERLSPGEPVSVFPGCVLDLGDGVSISVEHPT